MGEEERKEGGKPQLQDVSIGMAVSQRKIPEWFAFVRTCSQPHRVHTRERMAASQKQGRNHLPIRDDKLNLSDKGEVDTSRVHVQSHYLSCHPLWRVARNSVSGGGKWRRRLWRMNSAFTIAESYIIASCFNSTTRTAWGKERTSVMKWKSLFILFVFLSQVFTNRHATLRKFFLFLRSKALLIDNFSCYLIIQLFTAWL